MTSHVSHHRRRHRLLLIRGGDESEIGPRYTRAPFHAQILFWATLIFGSRPRFWRGKCEEFPKSDRPSKGGRRPFVRRKATRQGHVADRCRISGACNRDRDRLLSKHVAPLLRDGAPTRPRASAAENLLRLERQAAAGSVGAMKDLEGIFVEPRTSSSRSRQGRDPALEAGPCTAGGGYGWRCGLGVGRRSRLVKRRAAAVSSCG